MAHSWGSTLNFNTWIFDPLSLVLAVIASAALCLLIVMSEDDGGKSLAVYAFTYAAFLFVLLPLAKYDYFWNGTGDPVVFARNIGEMSSGGIGSITMMTQYQTYPGVIMLFAITSELTGLSPLLAFRLWYPLLMLALVFAVLYLGAKSSTQRKAALFLVILPVASFGSNLYDLFYPWGFVLAMALLAALVLRVRPTGRSELAIAILIALFCSISHPLPTLVVFGNLAVYEIVGRLQNRNHAKNSSAILAVCMVAVITTFVVGVFNTLPTGGNVVLSIIRAMFNDLFVSPSSGPPLLAQPSRSALIVLYSHYSEIFWALLLISGLLIGIRKSLRASMPLIALVILDGVIAVAVAFGFDIYQGLRIPLILFYLAGPVVLLPVSILLAQRRTWRLVCVGVFLILTLSFSLGSNFPNQNLTEWANPVYPKAPIYSVLWLNNYTSSSAIGEIIGAGTLGRYVQAFGTGTVLGEYNGTPDLNFTQALTHLSNTTLVIYPLSANYLQTVYLPYTQANVSSEIQSLNARANLIYSSGISVYLGT